MRGPLMIKLTAILKFVLEVFAKCEQIIVDGRKKLWFNKAVLGKDKAKVLEDALSRLNRYFNEEERLIIAQVYDTGEKSAMNLSKLLCLGIDQQIQSTIDTLPIGPSDYSAKQAEYNRKSADSPPSWMDDDEAYQKWISSWEPEHRWLWGLGGIGVGKTSLISYTAARLKSHVNIPGGQAHEVHVVNSHSKNQSTSQSLQKRAVALFYGDYETKDEQRPDYVFKCLIRQLLQQLHGYDTNRVLKRCNDILSLGRMAKVSHSLNWTTILDDLTSEFQETFLVIDALDKEESGYEDLVAELNKVRCPSVKILVTSRDEASIRIDAAHRGAIQMTIGADSKLIRSYVRKRLLRIQTHDEINEAIGTSALPAVLSNEFDSIFEIIVSNACGNFYKAEFQINTLLGEKTEDRVRNKLDVLPESLSEVISMDVGRVREQRDTYKQEVGLKVLILGAFAGRPLSVQEIKHALVLLMDPSTHGNYRRLKSKVELLTTDFLIDCSCQLLKVDNQSNTVQLDEAIKGYLVASNDATLIHYELAEVCLGFLDQMSFQLRSKSKAEYFSRRQEFPFYEYAARYWGFHLGRAGEIRFIGPNATIPLLTLFRRKLFLNVVAVVLHEDFGNARTWDWRNDTWKELGDQYASDPVVWPMHLITYFDLPRVADWWLRQNPGDVERKSVTGTTPLYLACLLNRVRIVEVLLFDHLANPTVRGSPPSGYCLAAAVFSQSLEIIERLLYVNSNETLRRGNWHGRKPLAEAAIKGDGKIVSRLIDACLSAPDGEDLLLSGERDGWTALHDAVSAPHPSLESIKLLIGAKGGEAFLERKTITWHDSALHLAAVKAQHEVVQTLLDLGADPGIRQSLGKTPLMLVVERPFVYPAHCIKILIAHDPDSVRLQDRDGSTAWHLAAGHGRSANLAWLIKLSPESLFNATRKDGLTPIGMALANGRNNWRECIEVLLQNCPDRIDEADAYAVLNTMIPDHSAISLRILRLLLERPEASWPYGHTTILHKIVQHGSLDAVFMAWDMMGSNDVLEYRDAGGATPLALATSMSAVEKASFLLEQGADPNARNNVGNTALHLAAIRDLPELVEALLSKGADYTLKNDEGLRAMDMVLPEKRCASLFQVVAAKCTPVQDIPKASLG